MPLKAFGIEPDIANFNAVRLSFYRGLPSLLVFPYGGNLFACLRRRQISNSPNNVSNICVYKSVDGGLNWFAHPGPVVSTASVGEGGSGNQNVTTQVEGNTVYFLITPSPPLGVGPLQMVTFNLDTLAYSSVSGGGPLSQNANTTAGLFVLGGTARIIYGRSVAGDWGWFYTNWTGGVWGSEEVAIAAGPTVQNEGQFAFNPANEDIGFWCRLNNVDNITVRHAGSWTAPVAFAAIPPPTPLLLVSSQTGFYSSETDSWVFPSSEFHSGPSAYDGVIVTASPSANPAAPVVESATPLTPSNFSLQYPVVQEVAGTFFFSYVVYDGSGAALQLLQTTRPASGGSWTAPAVVWDAGTDLYVNPPGVGNAVSGVFDIDVNMLGAATGLVIFTNPPLGVGGSATEYFLLRSGISLACPVNGEAIVGIPYEGQLVVTGGVEPFMFVKTAGAFPPGLVLNASTGVISGTATAVGTFSYTVQVTDAFGSTAEVTCSFIVIEIEIDITFWGVVRFMIRDEGGTAIARVGLGLGAVTCRSDRLVRVAHVLAKGLGVYGGAGAVVSARARRLGRRAFDRLDFPSLVGVSANYLATAAVIWFNWE